jgi:DNA-binding NtrC family response regulator
MAKILLIGYERDWLHGRQRGFLAAGHTVTCAQAFTQGLRSIQSGRFDVVVLGHSIPQQQRNALAAAAKKNHGGTRVLVLYSSRIDHAELADALVDTSASTDDLRQAVEYLVGTQVRSG